jgi:alkylated DNA repair dioxygenase AlkB
MNTLFPIEQSYPKGFSYHDNFISVEEEVKLIEDVKRINVTTFTFQGFEAKRKTASFSYDYSFDQRSLSKGEDIPEVSGWLIARVAEKTQINTNEIAELLVTQYPAGSVINWHRDAHPFDIIAGISLQSDCIFRLRPHEKETQTRPATISIAVKRRSLYIISGIARSEWQHSISPAKNERFSITLRSLRK